jgi:hypothetical protein
VGSWADSIRRQWQNDPRQFLIRTGIGLIALAVLVFLWQAVTAARALNEAKGVATSLTRAIAHGDVPRARTLLVEFDDATTRAHHRTDGPLWSLGAHVPFVGRNLAAVSTVSAQADAIADDALPKVVNVADKVRLDTFRPRNGRVDMAAVARTVTILEATNQVVTHADREIGAIQVDRLFAPLVGPFTELQEQTHQTSVAISTAYEAGKLLPTMLASDGKTRHYLLMVLNNAEVRSLVGMPGSYSELEAKNGKVSMARQSTPEEMSQLDDTAASDAKVAAEVDGGFNSRVGIDIRDTMIVPDFPRAAQLASDIAEERWDTKLDGVIAVDPVALGYVLRATGQISIGGGLSINQFNTASTLLNGIYLRYPNDNNAQNNAFKVAARKSFNALVSGRGNSVLAVQGLVRGVQERRIMLWSKHPSEERRISSGGLANVLTDAKQLNRPQLGVFMTDIGSAKMSYYLRMGTRVDATACYLGGVQDITMTTTVSSEAPQSGRSLPISIVGPGTWVKPGGMRFVTRLVAPPKAQIISVTVDGRRAPVESFVYKGRPITSVERVLFPAESSVIITKIRTGKHTAGAPLLHTTPGVVQNDDDPGVSACD